MRRFCLGYRTDLNTSSCQKRSLNWASTGRIGTVGVKRAPRVSVPAACKFPQYVVVELLTNRTVFPEKVSDDPAAAMVPQVGSRTLGGGALVIVTNPVALIVPVMADNWDVVPPTLI